VEATTGQAWSLPVLRFGRGIGLGLAAVNERKPDEPQSQATDFFVFQFGLGLTTVTMDVT